MDDGDVTQEHKMVWCSGFFLLFIAPLVKVTFCRSCVWAGWGGAAADGDWTVIWTWSPTSVFQDQMSIVRDYRCLCAYLGDSPSHQTSFTHSFILVLFFYLCLRQTNFRLALLATPLVLSAWAPSHLSHTCVWTYSVQTLFHNLNHFIISHFVFSTIHF